MYLCLEVVVQQDLQAVLAILVSRLRLEEVEFYKDFEEVKFYKDLKEVEFYKDFKEVKFYKDLEEVEFYKDLKEVFQDQNWKSSKPN